VDRLRYRRCFVRELVAFVARLHEPSLVEYLRAKRERDFGHSRVTTDVLPDSSLLGGDL
jgi:hypothetical protein